MSIKDINGSKIDQMAIKYTNNQKLFKMNQKSYFLSENGLSGNAGVLSSTYVYNRIKLCIICNSSQMQVYIFQALLIHRANACSCFDQGCQMVYFQTKNPCLCKDWKSVEWKRLIYSTDICNILWPFGVF
jgi:hypothetical protein